MTEKEKLIESCADLTEIEVADVRAFINGVKASRAVTLFTTVSRQGNWTDIKDAAARGILKSGDRIPVTLKSGEAITLIVGHDKEDNTYFCFDDALNEERAMNDTDTNAGGWAKTKMRTWLNNVLFYLLPDELQAIIEPTEIVQVIDGNHIKTKDKLFLLSMTQLFGSGDWNAAEPEDSQIDIFTTEKGRVKECGKHGTWPYFTRTPGACFERSAGSGNSNCFCCVSGSGGASHSGASYGRGAAPAFRITKS